MPLVVAADRALVDVVATERLKLWFGPEGLRPQ